MKTILYSDLIRRNVQIPNSMERAKLVDIVAEKREKYWVSEGIIIETGLLNSKGKFYPIDLLGKITQKGPLKLNSENSTTNVDREKKGYYLTKIKGSKLFSNEKIEIGRIYDFELYIGQKPWIVWKLLVNPTGISPIKRRIRIPTDKVDDYRGGKLYLKENWKPRGV